MSVLVLDSLFVWISVVLQQRLCVVHLAGMPQARHGLPRLSPNIIHFNPSSASACMLSMRSSKPSLPQQQGSHLIHASSQSAQASDSGHIVLQNCPVMQCDGQQITCNMHSNWLLWNRVCEYALQAHCDSGCSARHSGGRHSEAEHRLCTHIRPSSNRFSIHAVTKTKPQQAPRASPAHTSPAEPAVKLFLGSPAPLMGLILMPAGLPGCCLEIPRNELYAGPATAGRHNGVKPQENSSSEQASRVCYLRQAAATALTHHNLS